jgi:hypothetical protein
MHFWGWWHLLKNDRSHKVKVREGDGVYILPGEVSRVEGDDLRGCGMPWHLFIGNSCRSMSDDFAKMFFPPRVLRETLNAGVWRGLIWVLPGYLLAHFVVDARG